MIDGSFFGEIAMIFFDYLVLPEAYWLAIVYALDLLCKVFPTLERHQFCWKQNP